MEINTANLSAANTTKGGGNYPVLHSPSKKTYENSTFITGVHTGGSIDKKTTALDLAAKGEEIKNIYS